MKKKVLALSLAAAMAFSLAACGNGGGGEGGDSSTVANNQKPLVWFNRQPSNSATGELDMDALQYGIKNMTFVFKIMSTDYAL